MPTLLPKLGYPSTFPRPLVFGPAESGGIGLHDFNAFLLSRKIHFILQHIHSQTSISKLLLIMLRWAQIQAGIGEPIFTFSKSLTYLES